jgi:hypothetical protein
MDEFLMKIAEELPEKGHRCRGKVVVPTRAGSFVETMFFAHFGLICRTLFAENRRKQRKICL